MCVKSIEISEVCVLILLLFSLCLTKTARLRVDLR